MHYGVRQKNKKMRNWQKYGSPEDFIGSILIKGSDEILSNLQPLIPERALEYSGIIISNSRDLAAGDKIEKSCYAKGGFKFLNKAYDDQFCSPLVDGSAFSTIFENIGLLYAKELLGFHDSIVSLDSSWLVCQRNGDYGTMHNHTSPSCSQEDLFSGMLYLSVPETINPDTFPDGCLHLITKEGVAYVPPVSGSITLWPSKVLHGIHPFRGDGDRIGIAFNLKITQTN